jgi:hypothetical protein
MLLAGSEARNRVPSIVPEATDLDPLLGFTEPKPNKKVLPDCEMANVVASEREASAWPQGEAAS